MSERQDLSADVVVVGGGNAALCAALAAREQGADVLVLERAPEDERGGNSRFTAGAMRVVYDGVDDLLALIPDLTAEEQRTTDFGAYSFDNFFDDMARVTQYRADPDLTELLVSRSFEALKWMRTKGVRFAPMYARQAFKIDGRFRFWGGLTVEAWGGGPGLIDALYAATAVAGITVVYNARALDLICSDDGVRGVRVRINGTTQTIAA
ncbi:MAG: FAD-dependent oxidoreductase, partial [Proteobacteria bacterium]|nr:FAD-dependent oxidoreductase [Pseudomonadota bacterium]